MANSPKETRKVIKVLKLVIPFAAFLSVANVAVSMSTSTWLESKERIALTPNSSTMGEYMIKRTTSGLWYLCSFNLSETQDKDGIFTVPPELMNCSTIEYFVKDRYTSDPNDSTNAIRFAVTKAGPLFVIASILLGFGVISAAFGFQRHRRIALFISGISLIVSGLIIMIALVVYISALQSEVGPKLRPKTTVDLPQFQYYYGYSYVLIVAGFMGTEMTGILAIIYYLKWHQLDWTQKLGSIQEGMNNATNGNNLNLRNNSGNRPKSSSKSKCRSSHHNSSYKIGMYDKGKLTTQHPSYNAYQDKPEFDIPFPPPPPPPTTAAYTYLSMTRDFTTLTAYSEEDGFPPPPPPESGNKDRDNDHRNTTSV